MRNHMNRKSHTGRSPTTVEVLGLVSFPSKYTYTQYSGVATSKGLLLLTNFAYMFLEPQYVHAELMRICTSHTHLE